MKILTKIIDFVLPPRCCSCGELSYSHHRVCPTCWSQLTFITHPSCDRCGMPLPYAPLENSDHLLCGPCLVAPPPFDKGCSVLVYKGLTSKLILRFKHGDGTYLTPLFGNWLYSASQKHIGECDFIVPVPLHRWRLFKRRYNQATLLARYLGRLSCIPVLPMALRRHKNTVTQGHKNRKEREKNVQSAFRLSPQFRKETGLLAGKTICLVDDVWTTGATLSACTKVLKGAGAKKIIVLSLSRVVPDS